MAEIKNGVEYDPGTDLTEKYPQITLAVRGEKIVVDKKLAAKDWENFLKKLAFGRDEKEAREELCSSLLESVIIEEAQKKRGGKPNPQLLKGVEIEQSSWELQQYLADPDNFRPFESHIFYQELIPEIKGILLGDEKNALFRRCDNLWREYQKMCDQITFRIMYPKKYSPEGQTEEFKTLSEQWGRVKSIHAELQGNMRGAREKIKLFVNRLIPDIQEFRKEIEDYEKKKEEKKQS